MSPEVERIVSNFSAEARQVLEIWLACRGDALVPRQADFDPMLLPAQLSAIYIYRYDPDLDDFVCRLAGEDINQAWGHSIRGATLRQIVGDPVHPAALARWKAIIETPHIQHGRIDRDNDGRLEMVAERLVLPMRGDGEPDRVLGFGSYRYRQTDRDMVPPVWDGVVTIDCRDL